MKILKDLVKFFTRDQASTDKNNLTKKTKQNNLPCSRGLFTMSDYKALDINIEARVKPPEVIWHQTIQA